MLLTHRRKFVLSLQYICYSLTTLFRVVVAKMDSTAKKLEDVKVLGFPLSLIQSLSQLTNQPQLCMFSHILSPSLNLNHTHSLTRGRGEGSCENVSINSSLEV